MNLHQTIYENERIIILVADQVARRTRRACNCGRRHRLKLPIRNFREWAVEGFFYSVKLHAHLKGESPACNVIWWNWRTAWILKIIRVILRLEHIENERTSSLRGFHDE